MTNTRLRIFFVLLCLIALAPAAIVAIGQERTDPEDGATLSRPPRTLRIWLSHPPNVAETVCKLDGPSGPKELQGLHTMGENDLMIRIVGRMEDGEYAASCSTPNADDETQTVEWRFTVKRGG